MGSRLARVVLVGTLGMFAGCGTDSNPADDAATDADGGDGIASDARRTTDASADADAARCADRDNDGHTDVACGGDDCDDTHASAHPGAAEVCDMLDNDCNGVVDDGSGAGRACYADTDGDGYAPSGAAVSRTCDAMCPAHTTARAPADAMSTDCNDGDGSVWVTTMAFTDRDGDGHCASAAPVGLCTNGTLPAGYARTCAAGTSDDCDSTPGAWVNRVGYPDSDGDGHCISSAGSTFCTNGTLPAGYRAGCPGGFTDACDATPGAWVNVAGYPDADGDGRCAVTTTTTAHCTDGSQPAGWRASCPSPVPDCDDRNAAIYQPATCHQDGDGDGWCGPLGTMNFCGTGACPAGWAPTCMSGDCNDANPFATSTCTTSGTTISTGHCCCIGCGQPDPLNIGYSLCPSHFHLTSCNVVRDTGGGPTSATILDAHTCQLQQRCTLCEGVSSHLTYTCAAD
jgi:hypothetical protein